MKQTNVRGVVDVLEEGMSNTIITGKVKAAFIKEKLFGDKAMSVSHVHVETSDGIVSLTGTVKDKAEARLFNQVAKSVHGVKEVHSSLTLE